MKIKIAYFEITNKCNLNCMTCYNRSGSGKYRHEISVNQLRDGINTLLPLGLQRVLISGGEPSLHSEFDKILDLIHEYPKLSFGIVTNGIFHDRKLINTLNANDKITLQISLDGSCEEQNAKTRGAGNFEKTIGFAKQIHKNNPKPLLKMVISKKNIDDIEAFYKLAVSLCFMPEFAFIFKSGNGCDEWADKALSARQKLDALRLIDKLNKDMQTEALLPFCTDKCPYLKGTEEMSVCIKTNGSIQPCQTMYDNCFTLGNIFDFNLSAFEKGVNEFINLTKERVKVDFACHKCLLRENCNKGCMAAAVNLCNDPFGDDGDCEFRKLQFLGYNLKI